MFSRLPLGFEGQGLGVRRRGRGRGKTENWDSSLFIFIIEKNKHNTEGFRHILF